MKIALGFIVVMIALKIWARLASEHRIKNGDGINPWK